VLVISYEALTWALKEVDPVGLHRQSGIHTQEIHVWNRSEKQNAFKFKSAPHKQKSIVKKICQEDAHHPSPPLFANWALCLSTLKHNGKYGTAVVYIHSFVFVVLSGPMIFK
jgi:hypothetical protein